MVVKQQPDEVADEKLTPEQMAAAWFPEADLILLEGFKDSNYPKLEIIRRGNSSDCVCKEHNLRAVATDLDRGEITGLPEEVPVFGLEDTEQIARFIVKELQ